MTRTASGIIFYSILLIITFLLQISVLVHISFFNTHPFVMPFVVVLIAVFEGPWKGGAVGFACGLLCDAVLSSSTLFYTFFFLFVGIGIGYVCNKIFLKTFLTAAGFGIITAVVMNLLFFLFFFVFTGKGSTDMLIYVSLPEILVSIPFFPFLYLITRSIFRYCTK